LPCGGLFDNFHLFFPSFNPISGPPPFFSGVDTQTPVLSPWMFCFWNPFSLFLLFNFFFAFFHFLGNPLFSPTFYNDSFLCGHFPSGLGTVVLACSTFTFFFFSNYVLVKVFYSFAVLCSFGFDHPFLPRTRTHFLSCWF